MSDKSASVRKLAVDALTVAGPQGYENELAALRGDRSRAVRWRMDYLDRKWSGDISGKEDD